VRQSCNDCRRKEKIRAIAKDNVVAAAVKKYKSPAADQS